MTTTTTPPIRSLADLKRRAQAGVIFRCEHHTRPAVGGRRRIVKSGPITLEYEPLEGTHQGERCTFHWGRASDWRFHPDGNAATFVGRTNTFTYHFDQEG